MIRIASLTGLLALASTGTCATRQLPLGDAERGRQVFRTQRCVDCHSINREGGTTGPDLADVIDRGLTPSDMAALLWNHAPAMWRALRQKGITRLDLSRQQAADLFVYFYAVRNFERPGNARRGERVFRSDNCHQCHGNGERSWQSLDHPVLLAHEMWRHPRSQVLSHRTAQDLADMLVYLRSSAGIPDRAYFIPASPEEGRMLFVTKRCAACHHGNKAVEGRPTRYTLNDFAVAFWNHPQPPVSDASPLSREEMRRLAGYLLSIQFLDEHGDAGAGEQLFKRRGCASCHENRSDMAGAMTSYDLMAAIWKHGPAMNSTMHRKNMSWPHFSGPEMADLGAYLHGYEFKRRVSLP